MGEKKIADYIKTTFIESLFSTLFNLQAGRPNYYLNIVDAARNIFMNLGLEEKNKMLDIMIRQKLELPLRSNFLAIVNAYDNPKFMFSKKAFCKIGDSIEYRKITRYEIFLALEEIKRWIYSECSVLANDVRFTAIQQIQM